MDRRRAAGVLLALAACFACSAAAPTANNQTALDLYDGAPEGCYYNFQHYGEGDRIMTNEPCLNCTCHNRMLMCYLRVCPFTKPIGQDCTVEKRADQCCPIVTCPDVPVDLLTSTSTSSPAEYGATGLGKVDKYGCSINGKYFPEGSKVPPTPNKPCEHCYCIRNMTTCVMQECTLHVDGCTPIYHKDVCCPVRYSCDHPEDEMPLLDDMSTTVRPTPGFLLTTTTVAPVTQMTQDCVHDDQIFADGTSIKTEKPCEHCYCMKGDIVCVVQECGTPMENEGKNCTSLPPRDGQCCPDTYICEGDVLNTETLMDSTTELELEKITTLSPPMRGGVEGSGYRNEPDKVPHTSSPIPSEVEGSGDDQELVKPNTEPMKPEQPFDNDLMSTTQKEDEYISATPKVTTFVELLLTTETDKHIMEETTKPQIYTTISSIKEDGEKLTTSELMEEEAIEPHVLPTSSSPVEDGYEQMTTETSEPFNTILHSTDEKESKPHKYGPTTINTSKYEEEDSTKPREDEITTVKLIPSQEEHVTTEHLDDTFTTKPSSEVPEMSTIATTSVQDVTSAADIIPDNESDLDRTSTLSDKQETVSHTEKIDFIPTIIAERDEATTELDHAQNTVAVAEEETTHPYYHVSTTTQLLDHEITTETIVKEPHEYISTNIVPDNVEKTTTEPDKGLNTIPNEMIDENSSEQSITAKTTTLYTEIKSTESTVPEPSTLVSNTLVTTTDQNVITTEPSFRKEDESSVSTQKFNEIEASTVKAELEDEGLIPTSVYGDRFNTGSEVPYEDITTTLPEYAGGVETKQPSTESSQAAAESIPDNVPEIVSKPDEVPSYTETTTEDVTTKEEPSRIPGEGDCLLNGITYGNNSIVPSSNKCHSSCKCSSSIIKCDPIICSPPPNYMGNCESIYDPLDSCCPTYVCDNHKETIPPQSDNQMSGTESPQPPPTIECRGDQCEVIQPEKHHDQNICGPDGCGDEVQKPVVSEPSVDQPTNCEDGKCGPSAEGCPNGDCGTIGSQIYPQQPCNGDDCITNVSPEIPEFTTVNTIPCEGESCKKVDCGPNGCDSSVVLPGQETQIDCNGNEPCRRKEVSSVNKENTPKPIIDTSEPDQFVTPNPERQQDVSTNLPDTEQENTVPVEETFTEGPKDFYVTDLQESLTEKPSVLDDATKQTQSEEKPIDTDKDKEVTADSTDHPAITEDQDMNNYSTIIPDVEPVEEDKPHTPTIIENIATKKPELSDADLISINEGDKTEKPSFNKEDITEKPYEPEEISTLTAVTSKEDYEEKPISDDKEEDQTNKDKPFADKENEITTVTEQHSTVSTIQEISTEKSNLDEEIHKEKPLLGDKDEKPTEETTSIEQDGTEIPISADGEDKEKPITGTEKPIIIDESMPSTENMDEPQAPTRKPDVSENEEHQDPTNVYDGSTHTPVITEDQTTEKDTSFEDDGLLIPVKPILGQSITESEIDSESTEKPTRDKIYNTIDDDNKQSPTLAPEEESTQKPSSEIENTQNPVTEDESNFKPTEDVENHTDTLSVTEVTENPVESEIKTTVSKEDITRPDGEVTETPVVNQIEKDSDKPQVIEDESKPIDVDEGKPSSNEDQLTEKTVIPKDETTSEPEIHKEIIEKFDDTYKETTAKTDVEDDNNLQPTGAYKETTESVITEEGTYKPIIEDVGKEKPTNYEDMGKPPVIEDENKLKPTDLEDKFAENPIDIKETSSEKIPEKDDEIEFKPTEIYNENTDKPTDINEEFTKKPIIIDEDKHPQINTDKPTITEATTKKPVESSDKETEKPTITDMDNENKFKPTAVDDQLINTIIDGEKGTEKPEEDKFMSTGVEEGITEEPETEVTEKPGYIEDDTKLKPMGGDEHIPVEPFDTEDKDTMLTPSIEDQTEKHLVEDEHTEKPTSIDEKGTETPTATTYPEEISTTKPTTTDDVVKEKPTEVTEEDRQKLPSSDIGSDKNPTDKDAHTETPIIVNEEQKPVLGEENIEHPTGDEKGTGKPGIEEESKEKPVDKVSTVVGDKEIERPATTENDHIEKPISDEKGTDQSIIKDGDDRGKPEPTIDSLTEAPEEGYKEDTNEPTATNEDSTGKPEIQTENYTQEEGSGMDMSTIKSTELTDTELETKSPDFGTTPKHNIIDGETPTETPEIVTETLHEITTRKPIEFESSTGYELPDTEESITASPEPEPITDHKDISAGTPTEAGPTIIEPQEGFEPNVTEDIDTSAQPVPEQPSISEGVTVTTDEEKVTESYGHHEMTTNISEELTPENERTTEPTSSVTEPVKSFTEIEDAYVTGQEEMITGYPEKSTESQVALVTDKESDMLVTDLPATDKDITVPFEHPITELPIYEETSHVTEENIISSQEEKATHLPGIPDSEHSATIQPEIYTETLGSETEEPYLYVTPSRESLHTSKGEEPEVTEIPQSSTELSLSPDGIQTVMTSEAPQSLVTNVETQTKPDSVPTEYGEGTTASVTQVPKEDNTQTNDMQETLPLHETGTVQPDIKVTTSQEDTTTKHSEDFVTEQHTEPSLHKTTTEAITKSPENDISEATTEKRIEETEKSTEEPISPTDHSETTPYLIELEEHTHKMVEESSSPSSFDEENTTPYRRHGDQGADITTEKIIVPDTETVTKAIEVPIIPTDQSMPDEPLETDAESKVTTQLPDIPEDTTVAVSEYSEKPTITPDVSLPTERDMTATEKEFTTKATTIKQDEDQQTPVVDTFSKPEEKPSGSGDILPPVTTSEVPKPGITDIQPTDDIPAPEEDGHFPPSGTTGYGEPDYPEEDQAFGPGTCRYGGKVYVSAQQIPRDDPCDFCFCFRSDIICLQQSCPPPIHGCHEEPIQGFCCPRYECPVSMATTVNVTTTTTTTTTTLPPNFPTHSYKGAAQRRGCQIKGHTYKVGEVVRSSSGPCLHCTCGGDGQMKCDPKACTPEPMLRQMIAAAVSAKRRR